MFARLVDGTLIELGHDAPDGSVLFKISGQWKAGSITDQKTTFGEASIKKFKGSIATFGCGANGTLTLGIFDGCKDGFLAFDENGFVVCKTKSNIADDMMTEICSKAISVPADETISGRLVCTEKGIRKTNEGGEALIHVFPWVQIGTFNVFASYPATPQTLFTFTPALLTGYNEKYKTIWLKTQLRFGTLGQDTDIKILANGQVIHEGRVGEQGVDDPAADFINPTFVFPMPIVNANTPMPVTMELVFIAETSIVDTRLYINHTMHLVGWGY